MPCPKRCPNGTTCDKKAGRCVPKETIGQIVVQKTLKRFPNKLNANSKIVKDTAQKLDDLTDPVKSRSAIAWFKRRMNDTEFVVRTLYEYKLIVFTVILLLKPETIPKMANYVVRVVKNSIARAGDKTGVMIANHEPFTQYVVIPFVRMYRQSRHELSKIFQGKKTVDSLLNDETKQHVFTDTTLRIGLDTLKTFIEKKDGNSAARIFEDIQTRVEKEKCLNPKDATAAITILMAFVENAIRKTKNPERIEKYLSRLAVLQKLLDKKCQS